MPKNPAQREIYRRYLLGLDCEPTVDENLPFADSDRAEKEETQAVSAGRPRVSLTNRLINHFGEHWLEWIISSIMLVLVFLMYGSKIDLVKIASDLGNQGKSINQLEQDAKRLGEKIQDQNLQLREHSVRISNIEQQAKKKNE